jgi:hypothetical protein
MELTEMSDNKEIRDMLTQLQQSVNELTSILLATRRELDVHKKMLKELVHFNGEQTSDSFPMIREWREKKLKFDNIK